MAQSTYNHLNIEEKWLKTWENAGLFQGTEKGNNGLEIERRETDDDISNKLFLLFAFAYPSGSGLHVGHVESKTALDILARFYRMNGKEIFFPVGWDAFGLPAENYAIKTGVPPVETTKQAIDTFRAQIKRLAISYDWVCELATCHPGYYKWTQWLFLKLFESGLAYKKPGMVNWCPSCQTVLANEQVVNGLCERCDSEVIQKEMNQWYFKITKYADELISGLDQVDWPEATKKQQLEWIGKAKGVTIGFTLRQTDQVLPVWTKFWETVFGVTFLVIAPEKFTQWHMLDLVPSDKKPAVADYLKQAAKKTEEERKIGEKDKTGVDTGLTVINPVNGVEVPLFVADYVLSNVGTGVVMGVPSHDSRDFAFAKKFDLPCIQVVAYENHEVNEKVARGELSFEGEGTLVNSGQFDGLSAWGEGKEKLFTWMTEQGFAGWETTYRLRDWLISRQRYWGAPIPIVYDPEGKPHPVKQEHLPWMLPTDVEFKPTGESPLTHSKELRSRVEALYGKGWTPEFDTMDTFVDSSWYFLRYASVAGQKSLIQQQLTDNPEHRTLQWDRDWSQDESLPFDPETIKAWLPVDLYMIGPEHIVLHLLYARFFTKFLRDQGYLSFEEPFAKMRHQGMILGPDHKKMSKSKGNVINPDEIIQSYGADTLRLYEMFMGPIEADKPWDPRAVAGVYRFLKRLWHLLTQPSSQDNNFSFDPVLHKTLKQLSEQIPQLKYNTSIAALMELVNAWSGMEAISNIQKEMVIKMIAPFAPFMAEELWQGLRATSDGRRATIEGKPAVGDEEDVMNNERQTTSDATQSMLQSWTPTTSVHTQIWPEYDPALLASDTITIVVQINGKRRGELVLSDERGTTIDESMALELIKSDAQLAKWLEGKEVRKTILIKPGEKRQGLINVVVN
jgi:leucyl-tRNA synthetase